MRLQISEEGKQYSDSLEYYYIKGRELRDTMNVDLLLLRMFRHLKSPIDPSVVITASAFSSKEDRDSLKTGLSRPFEAGYLEEVD